VREKKPDCGVVVYEITGEEASRENADEYQALEYRRSRTDDPPLHARAESHIAAIGCVRNFSERAARALATSLEVNRETGWRDNKLCRSTRDICSCLYFIGGYPATSKKRTNGLIRNNNDAAECGQWGR